MTRQSTAGGLRILMQGRPDHRKRAGGDAIVIEALASQLRTRGHAVDVTPETTPDLASYDIVHIFNLEQTERAYRQAENAVRQGRPYMITPIYWPSDEAVPWTAYPFPEGLARLLLPRRAIEAVARRSADQTESAGAWRSRRDLAQDVLTGAHRIFASGQSERERLLRLFPKLSPDRIVVARFGHGPPVPTGPTEPVPDPGFVLCVGAMGPRKNQFALARALRDVPDLPILFIGGATPHNQAYAEKVRRAAKPGDMFLPDQPHGALPAFYEAAAVVVQPSFIELPGLVAMEALTLGRPVVASDREPVREYFEGLATFVDPASPDEIREACLAARAPDREHVARFAQNHRWEVVAGPVVLAYEQLAAEKYQKASKPENVPKPR